MKLENIIVYKSKLGTGVGVGNQLTIGGICGQTGAGEIKNCHTKDIEINGKTGDAVGGLFGIWEGAGNDALITNCSVDNCKVTCDEEGKEMLKAGGLVGFIKMNSTIKDTTVNKFSTDFATTSSQCQFNGGVAGLADGNITIDKVNVNQSNLKSGATTGGMVGFTSKANVTNSKVNETEIYMHNPDNSRCAVGGIVGFASTSNIDNATVDNVIIDSYVRTGGIVGFGDNTTVKNSDVNNTNITVTATARSTYLGGITGYAPRNCLIDSCNLLKTEIKLTGEGQEASVGGIAGHGYNGTSSTALIKRCNIENSRIQGTSGVGGIAGVAVSNITDCHTKNTSVEGTGDNVGGILGYGGAISTKVDTTTGEEVNQQKAVNITNCTIEEGSISGTSTGDIIGKNSHMAKPAEGAEDATEDVIEGCTCQLKEAE